MEEDADGDVVVSLAELTWLAVPARTTGYIQSIEGDSLLAVARARATIVRMECGIGEFVVEGTPPLRDGLTRCGRCHNRRVRGAGAPIGPS